MKIGVTGTRSGMTEDQFQEIKEFLGTVGVTELHHGDCVGVDVEVAELAKSMGVKTICHPPSKTDLRAYHESDEFRTPLSYFARNRNIVDETDILIVVPFQQTHQNNGGTWYTHDYANKRNKNVKVFFPKEPR